jgi:2-aminoadipate transaminase
VELALNRASDVPLYRQVVEQLGELIRSGVLATGSRLPTIRALADTTGLTRLTIQNAYLELGALGYIESHVGRGTFVAARTVPAITIRDSDALPPVSWTTQGILADLLSEPTEGISFARAMPDPASYPLRALQGMLREATEDPVLLGYGPVGGDPLLREGVSRVLLERGVVAPPEAILITNGAMNAIDLTFRTLAQRGDVIFVEQPTYPGALEAAARQGLRVVGLPLDDEGVRMADLESHLVRHQPRFLYLVPTYQNPMGICYSTPRRAQLLALARTHGLTIIEDDIYGLLPFERAAPPPLKAGDTDARVIYLSSFSKSFIPGLRLGMVTAPVAVLADIARTKQHSDLNSSPLLQRALALYLRRGHLGAHLAAVRALYRERCAAMQDALARYLPHCTWTEPEGGLTLWLTLPHGIDEAVVYREALHEGVGVARGQVFYPQPQAEGHLRLSYGAVSPALIEKGIGILGRVVAAHLRRRDALADRARREALPLM